MKKIGIFIISFFLFTFNSEAMNLINNMNINVDILEDGSAHVVENWQINSQNNTYYEKNFYDMNGAVISDLVISDSNNAPYEYVNNFSKSSIRKYNYKDKKNSGVIRFTTNGQNATINLDYKVSGMITKFDDTFALNWYFLASRSLEEISIINIYIRGPVEFNSTNTALYGIGSEVTTSFEEGAIHIFSSNVQQKSKIKLMASISDYEFTNYLTEKGTLLENYEKIANKLPLFDYLEEVFSNVFILILIVILVIVIIGFGIYKLIHKNKISNDYKYIISYNKQAIPNDLNLVPYCDFIPCDNDFYKIYFLANYYNIIKHRSSLVGAFIFKWVYENIIELREEENKHYLVLKENLSFENSLDQELYNILVSAANNYILDSSKLKRYVMSTPDTLVSWYDNVIKSVIKDEYISRNIHVKGKKIYLNKILYDEALQIEGLKKYLLNFNQVPRQTELTENIYKNLLISSVLLKVDENLYQEILRKNPDNTAGLLLKKFVNVKDIYSNIYSTSIEEFRKQKKKRNIKDFNPEQKKK